MAYAVLPAGAKPSKSASKDTTRPAMEGAELVKTDDGFELQTTNSYQLARVPLEVRDESKEPALTPGPISLDALKAIEKRGAGGFTANGVVEPVNEYGAKVGVAFVREERTGRWPNFDGLDPEQNGTLTLCFDIAQLAAVAAALGASGPQEPVMLQIDPAQAIPNGDGNAHYLKSMVVQVGRNGAKRGLLMPVRPNV